MLGNGMAFRDMSVDDARMLMWVYSAGAIYGLQGPLHWRNGVLIQRARQRLLAVE